MAAPIRVAVAGAAGRMGREVVRAVAGQPDLRVTGAIDVANVGADIGVLAGLGPLGTHVTSDLPAALASCDVLVDFSVPGAVRANVAAALAAGVSPVVGATGLTPDDLAALATHARAAGVGGLVAPNFALGAVLLMEFARQAARHFADVEVIELHHERKLDAPSGTALRTAALIAAERRGRPSIPPDGAAETHQGARGTEVEGVHIHSVRLPGLVAHQEVIFGSQGQTLTLRHDSSDRTSFMPGVLLGIRRVRGLDGLVIGLEHLL